MQTPCLLHMEIVQERLERENDIDVVQTSPTVSYEVVTTGGVVKKRLALRPAGSCHRSISNCDVSTKHHPYRRFFIYLPLCVQGA